MRPCQHTNAFAVSRAELVDTGVIVDKIEMDFDENKSNNTDLCYLIYVFV